MKMNHFAVLFVALWTAKAHGFPSVYVENSELRSIVEPRSSAMLVGDLQEPSKVWVLPPHSGTASVTDITPTGSLSLCSRTKTLLTEAQEQENDRLNYAVDLRRHMREAKRLKVDVDEKKAGIDKLLQNPDLKKMVDLIDKIDRLEKEILKLYEELYEAETDAEAAAIQAMIDSREQEQSDARDELRELKKKHRKVLRDYKKVKRRYDYAKESYDAKVEQIEGVKKNLARVENEIRRLFKYRAKITGAMAHINFDSRWEREVDRLNNKHSQLTFQPMPTYNTRLSISLVPTNSKGKLYTDLPALIGYGTFGTELFYGERLKSGDPERPGTGVPDIADMSLSLNLLGACPIVDKDFFADYDFDVRRNSEGKPVFGLAATYEYEVAAPFNVEVSYNLWQIYKLVANKSPLYGSIEPKVIRDLVKKSWPKGLVSIQGAESYAARKRTQLEEEVKSELINRVLTTVAKPSEGNLNPLPAIGLPPVKGAYSLAYGQNTSCGTSVYCQSGRWIVRIGDAVFGEKIGGKQTLSKMFKEDWDKTITESWRAGNPVPRQGISHFPLMAKPPLDPSLVNRAYKSYQEIAKTPLPPNLNVEERSIFQGFYVASKFDKEVFDETGVQALIGAIFEGNNTAVKLKTITTIEQFRQLVFPEESAPLTAPRRTSLAPLAAAYTGGWGSVQQLDRHIDGVAFIERLNAGTLSLEEIREFEQLLGYRDALQLAAIDRRLAEIGELLEAR